MAEKLEADGIILKFSMQIFSLKVRMGKINEGFYLYFLYDLILNLIHGFI
jgi:hypothetical protein